MRKLVIIGAAVAVVAGGGAYALADTSSGPLGVTATCGLIAGYAPPTFVEQITFTTGSENTWGIVATVRRNGRIITPSPGVPITLANRLDHNQSVAGTTLVSAPADQALIAFVGPDGYPHVFAVKCAS